MRQIGPTESEGSPPNTGAPRGGPGIFNCGVPSVGEGLRPAPGVSAGAAPRPVRPRRVVVVFRLQRDAVGVPAKTLEVTRSRRGSPDREDDGGLLMGGHGRREPCDDVGRSGRTFDCREVLTTSLSPGARVFAADNLPPEVGGTWSARFTDACGSQADPCPPMMLAGHLGPMSAVLRSPASP